MIAGFGLPERPLPHSGPRGRDGRLMPILVAAVLAGLGWAWWTGRLKGYTYEDGVALALFLLGLRLLTTGRVCRALR
jgi:hypothetical protein